MKDSSAPTMEVPPRPYTLPLSRAQFADALQKGLGRAVLHVRSHGVQGARVAEGMADAVLHACTHHLAYDPQCEGPRAAWVATIVEAAGLGDAATDALLEALPWENERPAGYGAWDVAHRFRLTALLAERGVGRPSDLRRGLYAAMRRSTHTADVYGDKDIALLDGPDGLLFVATRIGAWLQEAPDFWADDWILAVYDDRYGEGSARRVLDAAAGDPRVARFLDEMAEAAEDGRQRDRSRARQQEAIELSSLTASGIIGEIERGDVKRGITWYSRWARQAADDELVTVAQAMFAQREPDRLLKYLDVFRRRPLPTYDPRLESLADHPDDRVRSLAVDAIAQHEDPAVRAFALRRLREGRLAEGAIELLKRNYHAGDHAQLEAALRNADLGDDPHYVFLGLLAVCEANPRPETSDLLLTLYEHTPCALCRGGAAKALARLAPLPDWLTAEAPHDADEAVRGVAGTGEEEVGSP